jgi:hypothetical protein
VLVEAPVSGPIHQVLDLAIDNLLADNIADLPIRACVNGRRGLRGVYILIPVISPREIDLFRLFIQTYSIQPIFKYMPFPLKLSIGQYYCGGNVSLKP